jgi:tetratricopeptide (TPR) repeat protein
MLLYAAWAAALLLAGPAISLRADDSPPAGAGESLPVQTLKGIVERQRTILADAAKAGSQLDTESVRDQLQGLCHDYELLLRGSPDFAAGYASYGYLLCKVGMDKEALGVLLKANKLDPDNPFVKNQIGNCLAETGKPIDAAAYYLAAIRLAPKEPLYHYQLGMLLYAAHDEFVRTGDWTRASVEFAMNDAFRQAAELAPDRIEFTYRYAESFYDMRNPNWDEALKAWAGLEEKAQSPVERQTMRLQAANILVIQGKFDPARILIASVTEPALAAQKQKLVARLPESAKK